jgi:hypothetical protein
MSLTLTVTVGARLKETSTEGKSTSTDRVDTIETFVFTEAAGAMGVEAQWNDYRTLGGAADSLDLAGGVTNRLGSTKTFIKLKSLGIKAASTNVGNLTVGGGSNAVISALPAMTPGAHYELVWPDAAGLAVTASTADILQVSGTSGDKYEIVVAGEV